MVETAQHPLFDNPLDDTQIHHVACPRIHFALQGHVQLVVVPVIVRVVAQGEDPAIFLIGQFRVVETVRGAEMDSTGYGDGWHGGNIKGAGSGERGAGPAHHTTPRVGRGPLPAPCSPLPSLTFSYIVAIFTLT